MRSVHRFTGSWSDHSSEPLLCLLRLGQVQPQQAPRVACEQVIWAGADILTAGMASTDTRSQMLQPWVH